MITDINKEIFIQEMIKFLNRRKYINFFKMVFTGLLSLGHLFMAGYVSYNTTMYDGHIDFLSVILISIVIILNVFFSVSLFELTKEIWQRIKLMIYQISLLSIIRYQKDTSYNDIANIYLNDLNINLRN